MWPLSFLSCVKPDDLPDRPATMWRSLDAILHVATTGMAPAHAASDCANSVSELQTILESAEVENDDSLVRMASGVH